MEQASLESSTFGASRDAAQDRAVPSPSTATTAQSAARAAEDAPAAASAAIGSFSRRGAFVALLVLVAASFARHGVTERSMIGYVLASACFAFAVGTYVTARRRARAEVAAAFARAGVSEQDAEARARDMVERAEQR